MGTFKGVATVGVLALFFCGCASATLIQTNPEGAKVRIDGAVIGETPYTYEDTSPLGASHVIALEKPGYARTTLIIRRDQANPARVVLFGVGGFICFPVWLGLVWAADYPPMFDVELTPEGAVPPSPMQSPPPFQPPPRIPPPPPPPTS